MGKACARQLDMFTPEPAPAPRTAPCTDHDTKHVCDRCPERYDTDSKGFVHHSQRKGRVALRHCRCGRLVTFDHWIVFEHVDVCEWCKPKPFPPCARPVCKPACGLHARCPYEADAHADQYRRQVRKRQRLGPLEHIQGMYAAGHERWDPWGEAGTGDDMARSEEGTSE